MCKSSKMRVSKRLIATSIIYGGAEALLRGVLEPPEPHPVHATVYRQASWRAVIWCLYKANEIQLADQIRSYGKQLEGMCLCIHNTTAHSTYWFI